MKSFALSLSALVLAVTLAGCSGNTTSSSNSDTKAAGDTIPAHLTLKTCPMCKMDVNKEVATTSFDGKTVGYCNEHCKETFEKMSDEEKKEILAKMEKSDKEADHDHEHEEDHDHDKKEEKKES